MPSPHPSVHQLSSLKHSGQPSPREPGSGAILSAIPPPGLVLLAITAIQVGAGLATHLFPVLGAEGTVAVRIVLSACLLVVAAGGKVRSFGQTFLRNWVLLAAFGLCVAAMNLFFYQSIARIPLGAAVAIEFIGPLGVAALTSRRVSHFVSVAIAAIGIILLSPLSGTSLDMLGIVFALLAGVGWACFIVLAGQVGKRVPGNDGLATAMIVAAITMIPFFAPVAVDLISDPLILIAGFGVALLSTTIPFTLEFQALKRLSARAYGVLVSLEPAVALLVGAVLLDERIGAQGIVAVTCVVTAAVGITLAESRGK